MNSNIFFYYVNRLLLRMNFCTDKKISVFWLIVNSLDPTNRSSVDKGIGRLRDSKNEFKYIFLLWQYPTKKQNML
jgi:hypothetical protein